MASKKRQNLQIASQSQKKTHKKALETVSFDNDGEEEEDEDALEMEKNFALLSKRGSVPTSDRTEEESDEVVDYEENTDEDDHGEDFVTQRDRERKPPDSVKAGFTPDLSTMSFEEIMRLQSKIGTKACNKLIRKHKTNENEKKQKPGPAKRSNKDRPEEISAKKPVAYLRRVGSVKAPILRDPRFDDLSGEFKPEVFSQTYKFIEDIRQREAEMVKKKLKKIKSNAKKEEMKSFLKRLENQKRNLERRDQQREKELGYKKKRRVLVGDGHRPFYLKKSEQKKLQLAEKYSELKKSGKLENFMSKKRKRNTVKDRRRMPRSTEGGSVASSRRK
ncbi:ribosomal RNA processing protein 36 homolog [Tachysurus fulvidraco]|uniref:ribosomal RNA processing protein 36 homolog n=1 Tax=Tachysurus fulvidraco TaxID=1234273 RepID=UPI001FEF443F|nr:ribosomal RNA processing protein 36 homolog [Tachysurus fulvidraco]